MVYIHSWQEFQDAAEALYAKSPYNTRYVVKWKSSEGKLVLKITDNVTCIKFKTNSSIFLNRFEALNLSLMEKMQNRKKKEEAPSSIAGPAVLPSVESDPTHPAPAGNSSAIPTQTPSGAGVKKKKGKKKK